MLDAWALIGESRGDTDEPKIGEGDASMQRPRPSRKHSKAEQEASPKKRPRLKGSIANEKMAEEEPSRDCLDET